MKKTHLLLLILLISCIAVVTSLMYKSDTYSSFSEAAKMKDGKNIQIIGSLVQPPAPHYDTVAGKRVFIFRMKDHLGEESEVHYSDAAPRDFEKLTEIVVTGKMANGIFQAESMLLKCPSKYNDEKQPEGYENKEFGQGK